VSLRSRTLWQAISRPVKKPPKTRPTAFDFCAGDSEVIRHMEKDHAPPTSRSSSSPVTTQFVKTLKDGVTSTELIRLADQSKPQLSVGRSDRLYSSCS